MEEPMKPDTIGTRWIAFCILLTVLPLLNGCAVRKWPPKCTAETWADPWHGKEITIRVNRSVSLEMVYVDGSSFLMGSPKQEVFRRDDEGPVHEVELDGFWMGKYEITQAQYKAITGENPSLYKGKRRPVEKVSWEDTMAFCRQLSEKLGYTFTLPTEAQWEYACRAGTTGSFTFGECLSTADANYDGNYPIRGCPEGEYRKETWVAGSGKPNDWGLYDMHGNVWEWCLDYYSPEYITHITRKNPVGPPTGRERVFRGGSWSSDARNCRSAARYRSIPASSGEIVGFRIVMNGPADKTDMVQPD
jgi:eukaryotic-like serine/threonine-protein kinase